MLDPKILALLVCPVDYQPLRDDDALLVCTVCNRRYPVIDGIPVMLVDETESSDS